MIISTAVIEIPDEAILHGYGNIFDDIHRQFNPYGMLLFRGIYWQRIPTGYLGICYSLSNVYNPNIMKSLLSGVV